MRSFVPWAAACLAMSVGCASTPTSPTIPEGRVALRLQGVDGTVLNLAALRGRLVLVSMLATWSDPSLVELRLFSTMKEQHPELEVVCIVLEPTQEMLQIFAEVFDAPCWVGAVDDPAQFASDDGPFGPISVIPTSVIIDYDGRIAARMDGMWPPAVLAEALDRLDRGEKVAGGSGGT